MNIDQYFISRRTVRRFTSQPIESHLLEQMLEEAAHAPNTGGMQLYSVVVTTSTEGKEALAPLHFNQPCARNCAALLTFCIDMNRFGLWCDASDADMAFGNLQMLLAGAVDTALFAQQFNTIAELHGLGCCYLGTTAYNAPEIASVLALPKGVVPLVSIAVGYPDGESPATERLPLNAVIHHERYHNHSASEIADIYAALESRPESRRFVADNAKQNLAQVFAEVRYPRATLEAFSQKLAEFLNTNFYE